MSDHAASQQQQRAVQRRTSMPQELEDPEDLTVSDTDVGRYKVLEVAVAVTGADVGSTAAAAMASHSAAATSAGGATTPASYTSEAAVASLQELPKSLRSLIAGGVAGMVAKSVVAPLDRIKILYQTSSAEFKIRFIPTVVRNIIANEGWAALWKGNIATLLRVFPYAGVQFMVFDWIKMWQLRQHEIVNEESPSGHPGDANNNQQHSRKFGLTAMESLGAGMVAGTVSVVCTYPLDLARAQLAVLKRHKHPHGHAQQQQQAQLATTKTKGFVRVILDNYRRAGVPGLFRGMPVTLIGILPYSGIAFALNEQGKREIQHVTGRDVTTLERLECGAVAGLFAQTLTYPIEVTRRRMQTLGLVGNDTAFGNVGVTANGGSVGGAGAADSSMKRPPNLAQTIRHLYAEQGVRGFFKGVSVNWAKGPIAFGISFTMFDTVQHFLETPAERALRLPRGH